MGKLVCNIGRPFFLRPLKWSEVDWRSGGLWRGNGTEKCPREPHGRLKRQLKKTQIEMMIFVEIRFW